MLPPRVLSFLSWFRARDFPPIFFPITHTQQVAANLFTYQYSGLNGDQALWNFGAGGDNTGGTWNTPNVAYDPASSVNWEWTDKSGDTAAHHSPCYALAGQDSFCKWGWARTMFVFSTFNLFSMAFTSFTAFAWYAGL